MVTAMALVRQGGFRRADYQLALLDGSEGLLTNGAWVDSPLPPSYLAAMHMRIGDRVMLRGYHPYPRYGRVAKEMDDGQVLMTQVECGDPRCASEHVHADAVC
jgi:hypothetical protein